MSGKITRARRALMYVPGSDERKIIKSTSLGLDGAILDLEDGVAFNRKDEARATIRRALENVDFGRTERLVRINPLYSGRAEEDLEAVLPGRPDAILIPKTDSPQIVSAVDDLISAFEQNRGWDTGAIALLLLIESAAAFVNLADICRASPRVQALVFGAEDFCADAGVTRTIEARELLYVRSALVMHAAAFGLQAIDMVQVNYLETSLLTKECRDAVELGFTGKTMVHPAQIEVVQRAFTPSQELINYAREIVDGAEAAQRDGRGVFTHEGKLVDLPVVKRAENILARARAAGMIT
ncbi:MAG TPA: CoA ester lyase [Anaerolineaceae bacterium]|nr:CoA ester lyase [Anaerolineaceae bacterium]